MSDLIERAFNIDTDKRMKKEELEIIYDWGKKFYKGGNTLEIGAFKGMTSIVLCGILDEAKSRKPESRHYIIDLFEDVFGGDNEWSYGVHTAEMLTANLGDLKDLANVFKGDSLGFQTIKHIFEQHYDYVWIDGDHRHPQLFLELCMAEAVSDKILGHDYPHPGVKLSVDLFCKIRGYEIVKPNGQYGCFELIKK